MYANESPNYKCEIVKTYCASVSCKFSERGMVDIFLTSETVATYLPLVAFIGLYPISCSSVLEKLDNHFSAFSVCREK